MIGCTLWWSLLNFKQANSVLATNTVAALCGGSALHDRESVCSSTEPGASVGRPQLTASQTRAGGEGANMDLARKCLCFLSHAAVCVNAYRLAMGASTCVNMCHCCVRCGTIGYKSHLSAIEILILMTISGYQYELCMYTFGCLIKRGAN